MLLCAGCQADPAETTTVEALQEPQAGSDASRSALQQTDDARPPSDEPQLQIATGPRVYECRFKTHGTIVIDTDPRDTRIVINGLSMPAQSGSYFYQTLDDGAEIVFFGPDQSYWVYKDERADNCTVR